MAIVERKGGPAFPTEFGEDANGIPQHHTGMSLRDWFAGQALAGLLSKPVAPTATVLFDGAAHHAYAFADAMLAERAKEVSQ